MPSELAVNSKVIRVGFRNCVAIDLPSVEDARNLCDFYRGRTFDYTLRNGNVVNLRVRPDRSIEQRDLISFLSKMWEMVNSRLIELQLRDQYNIGRNNISLYLERKADSTIIEIVIASKKIDEPVQVKPQNACLSVFQYEVDNLNGIINTAKKFLEDRERQRL